MTTLQIKRKKFMFFSGTRKILKVSRDTLRYTSYPEGLWAKYKLSGTQEMTSYRHCGLNTARKKTVERDIFGWCIQTSTACYTNGSVKQTTFFNSRLKEVR